jgi:hypothetical protein
MRYCTLLAAVLLMAAPMSLAQSYRGEVAYSLDDLILSQRCGYDFVRIQGVQQSTAAGAPCLPSDRIHVAVPPEATAFTVRLLDKTSIELDGKYEVMPCSDPICLSSPPPEDPLKKDPAVYGQEADYPGRLVEVFHSWDLLGQDFVTLAVHPVQFNPVTGKLVLHTRLRFEVTWREAPGSVRPTYNFSRKLVAQHNRRLKTIPVNPEDVAPLPAYKPHGRSPLKPGQFECVVITIPDMHWLLEFEPYVQWRTQMGMPAKIVDVDWIYANYPDAGDPYNVLQGRIRNFIIDAHATWGAMYFLLGGDAGFVPCHLSWEPSLIGFGLDLVANDTYYADFDDDWKCEVYVGRSCSRNHADVHRFVNKVLTYEKSPPAEYGNKVFFMGFDLDQDTHGEDVKKFIYDSWIPPGANYERSYDSSPGRHMANCLALLDEGQNLVNHIDHGSDYQMGAGWLNHGEWMHSGHAQFCKNGTKYFNIHSIGCYCAHFIGNCIAEYFVWDDQGAITFVGNSAYGGYMYGAPLAYSGKFDHLWYKAIYEHGGYRAGEALASCKNEYEVSVGYEVDEYLFKGLTLLGDPALHLWIFDPEALDVRYRSPIGLGPRQFQVIVKDFTGSPVEGALVCAANGREVYSVETTDAAGRASLFINATGECEMKVTVTARNHRHHEGVVPIVR